MDNSHILDSLFREAVSAIDAGDVTMLERLLTEHPRLVRDRLDAPGAWLRDQVGDALDGFFQKPYLLWFVAEDPIRNGKLPRNIARVTRAIVQAAEREGVDSLQEQLDYALHLAVCSPVERESGLQTALIDALIDAGASPDRTLDALVCRNLAAAEHLLERGAPLTLPTAVCLERWDDVARLARTASAEDKQIALTAAALNGKAKALTTLIALGVSLNDYSSGFHKRGLTASRSRNCCWMRARTSPRAVNTAAPRCTGRRGMGTLRWSICCWNTARPSRSPTRISTARRWAGRRTVRRTAATPTAITSLSPKRCGGMGRKSDPLEQVAGSGRKERTE